jgi:hypothetical protein
MSDSGDTEADSLGDLGEQPSSPFDEVTFAGKTFFKHLVIYLQDLVPRTRQH